MTYFGNLVYWDNDYNSVMVINLLIAIAIFTSIRLFSGVISHINAYDEMFKKDNPAFGISMAAVIFAVTIVLAGAVFGDPVQTIEDSVVAVGLYGIIGIALMALSRCIFDKIAIRQISIRDEIIRGNVAAAFIDGGNVIASAIVIRAVMMWVEVNTIEGILALLVGYVISQILLTAITYARLLVLSKRSQGVDFQEEIKSGNIALALRFTGRRIGAAFAITAASSVMVYELNDIYSLLTGWIVVSVVMLLILTILSYIADAVILWGVNANDEIIRQRNPALGAIQAAIYISLGLLLAELMM